jgi:hypothetical protein
MALMKYPPNFVRNGYEFKRVFFNAFSCDYRFKDLSACSTPSDKRSVIKKTSKEVVVQNLYLRKM